VTIVINPWTGLETLYPRRPDEAITGPSPGRRGYICSGDELGVGRSVVRLALRQDVLIPSNAAANEAGLAGSWQSSVAA
jgi:hypothetical protein